MISLTSASHVCGFIATIRSTPPRRPSQPASDTRTSYQVGNPWMLDGKMLRAPTGTPIRRMTLANSPLALADPDPFTLANLTTKSFVAVSGFDMDREECLVARTIEGGQSATGTPSIPGTGRQKKAAGAGFR